MSEPYAKLDKSVTEGQTLHDSTHMRYLDSQIIETESRMVSQGL